MSDSADDLTQCYDNLRAARDQVTTLQNQALALLQQNADLAAQVAALQAAAGDGVVMDTTDMTPNVRLVVIGCTTEDAARAAVQNSIYKPAAVVRAGTLVGVGGGVLRLDLD